MLEKIRKSVKRDIKIIVLFMIGLIVLFLQACSTVRDATDWVPGVDSNAEVQAEIAEETKQKQDKVYQDKLVFEARMNGPIAENDATINVSISQQYVNDIMIQREDIGIEVNAGIVTLTGSVASEKSAVKAIAIAKNTKGVAKVISKLVVIRVREK